MGKYLVIDGADFSQVAVEKLNFKTVITYFNVSKVKNVKYANNNNKGLFYYTIEQSLEAKRYISYIVPYKLKVGSTVTVKFKEGAKCTLGNTLGALHSFSEVPANLSPYELLDSNYGTYLEMSKGQSEPYKYEFTFLIQQGFQYVELYLFDAETYSPSDISDSIESITITVDDEE